jgi:hypothetical protein
VLKEFIEMEVMFADAEYKILDTQLESSDSDEFVHLSGHGDEIESPRTARSNERKETKEAKRSSVSAGTTSQHLQFIRSPVSDEDDNPSPSQSNRWFCCRRRK